jgi:hypothetical protein
MRDAAAPSDPSDKAKVLSPLDQAILSEKMKGASDLEISLRLHIDVAVVRRHLQRIAWTPEGLALIKKQTEAMSEQMSGVWQRWLDEPLPESMETTLLLAIVVNVAVESLAPLVSAVAIAGSRGGLGPTRRVGRGLVDSIWEGLRRHVDSMIVDDEKDRANRS